MCGGTELGATYLHGSLLQPQGLAVFSTPSIACSFVILDEQGVPYVSAQDQNVHYLLVKVQKLFLSRPVLWVEGIWLACTAARQ